MSAQINLYQDEFHIRRTRLGLMQMVELTAVCAVFLILLSVPDIWKTHEANSELRRLDSEKAALDAERRRYEDTYANVQADPRLAEKISDYEIILANLVPLQQLYVDSSFSEDSGYSRYLIALARQRLPGMWFDSIHIKGAGHGLELQGQTRSARLLPEYLQDLSKEKLLAGTQFGKLHLKQADSGKGTGGRQPLQFSITTDNSGGEESK